MPEHIAKARMSLNSAGNPADLIRQSLPDTYDNAMISQVIKLLGYDSNGNPLTINGKPKQA